jgi:hypothetical protein
MIRAQWLNLLCLRGPARRSLLFLAVWLLAVTVVAREQTSPLSWRRPVAALQTIAQSILPPTDVTNELTADARQPELTPLRFAVSSKVEVTPATHGTWEQLPDGRLWRYRVMSAGATDLNFGFTTFWLPPGATLHVYSQDEAYSQGPYSAEDNKGHGQLWTPVLPGAGAVIELFVPAQTKEEPRLVLTQIGCGYRDLFHRRKDLSQPKAGTCNIDVICPQADSWRDEIRSVARYTISGNTLCSGTLLNNTAGDLRSFFLTANHCELSSGNAATVVVYWNYESPTCGEHGGGSLAQNQSGAVFRAARADVDFALIELDTIPDSAFHVYYAGWDRSGAAPAGCVGIHHPNGDEKSISFATALLTTVNNCIGSGGSSVNTHWQVIWSLGVTERGSSGSGIWDPATHGLVGTLSGGYSACSDPTGPDCYGKFSVAWTGGTSAANRLRDWLDPSNTGATRLAGLDPNLAPVILPAGSTLVSESCAPTNGLLDPGETVTVSLALTNGGKLSTLNLVATLLASAQVISPSGPQYYGTLTPGGPAQTGLFAFTVGGTCGGTVTNTLQLQDGTNNLGQVSFTFLTGTPFAITNLAESFDSVSAPALPAGWSNTASGSTGWKTTSAASHTATQSVLASDPGVTSDASLISPPLAIATTNAQVSFFHKYSTETGYDGGVLEISITNGAFADIVSAGGSFLAGAYNAVISTGFSSPIAGRSAWSGYSSGFVSTIARLPASAAGQSVRLRWRMASDSSVSGTGWYVDTITVSESGYSCCHHLVQPQLVNLRCASGNLLFSYDTVVGQIYFTECKARLDAAAWTLLQAVVGDGTQKCVTNATSSTTQRCFRVRTQ